MTVTPMLEVPQTPTLGELIGNPDLGVQFTNWLADLMLSQTQQGLDEAPPKLGENPMGALQYMMNKRDINIMAAQQRPMVRLADGDLTLMAELTGEMSCEYEELVADSGQAKFVVRYENWIVDQIVNLTRADEDLHLIIDPIPTARTWRTRWGGKIHTINIERHEDGTSTVELLAVSMREHAKRLLFGANPFFAPEIQLPRMWVLPGPIRTVLFISMFVNLARLFVPGLSFITNAFNPAGWLNPLSTEGLFNVDPLAWPIQVAFVNPAFDTSRWTVLGATWSDWHSTTEAMLKDAGSIIRFYTWLDEDVDSPHQELTDLIDLLPEPIEGWVGKVIRPLRNCIVASVEDWSGHQGPTGTPIDGILNTIGVTLDDLVTSVFVDADTGLTLDGQTLYDAEGELPLFQTFLGVAPEPPKVIYREGQFSGVVASSHVIHKGSIRTYMTGSRSPTLVNELQTFGIKYGLSQISEMINAAIGTWVNTAWENPGTPGLEEIYQGQLDNTLFAWERLTSPIIALWAGDIAYQEIYEKGQGTAYTLAGILTLRETMYKHRAFHAFQATVRNGVPWILDQDLRLGERGGWEFGQIIYVDALTALKRGWDRQKPVLSTVSIGDDKDKDDSFARGMRVLQGLYSYVGMIAGEGTIFA